MGCVCDICKHRCDQYGREWCGKGLSELFNRPELYEEDCPEFEDEDIDDPLPDEENPFLPSSIECPQCGEDANQVPGENRYNCPNDDCGWEGTLEDARV